MHFEQSLQTYEGALLIAQSQMGFGGVQMRLTEAGFCLLGPRQQKQGLSETTGLNVDAAEIGEGLGVVRAEPQGGSQRLFRSLEISLPGINQAQAVMRLRECRVRLDGLAEGVRGLVP